VRRYGEHPVTVNATPLSIAGTCLELNGTSTVATA
jgi:hypothetical protein